MVKLTGKNAIVIGGSRGIGAGIVRKLAEYGASVAFTYVSSKDAADAPAKEISSKHGFCRAVMVDSTNSAQMQLMVNNLAAADGVDILVNNAGLFVTGSIGESSKNVAAIEKMWNLYG